MPRQGHREGGKFGGAHTTYIPLAEDVADILNEDANITRISAGYIKAGLRPNGGQRRVKIAEIGGILELKVRDTASFQEVRAYVANSGVLHLTKLNLARKLRDRNIAISFRKDV